MLLDRDELRHPTPRHDWPGIREAAAGALVCLLWLAALQLLGLVVQP